MVVYSLSKIKSPPATVGVSLKVIESKYGCSSDVTRTWVQSIDGNKTAVILAYHTALHVFSKKNDLNASEICKLVDEVNPTIVNASADTIRILEPEIIKFGFVSEFGHIGEWCERVALQESVVGHQRLTLSHRNASYGYNNCE